MSAPILTTKLYVPPPGRKTVLRSRLIERLNAGLYRRLTLISAPAGSGKTTLVSEWIAGSERPAAWLSLDEGDKDPARFLAYLVAALQMIEPTIGEGVLRVLQIPQPPPIDSILTGLVNEITTLSQDCILVLDDYHVIDAKPIDAILTFLLQHLPPRMHMVIMTREDPRLPLAQIRARGQLTEVRANDLRFTPSEAAQFLGEGMGLTLSTDDIAALDARTEGWIAGLQLAGLALQGTISMQGHQDTTRFIESFTGSHHFVMDYLVEEVLYQQGESIQTFLLQTSILDRLCGPLCDALMLAPDGSGQAMLEYLERANLFLVPLDGERHWYRYHHLFADLLRQRLAVSMAGAAGGVNALHIRASQWYEDNELGLEAFHHAAAANDIERAERLIGSKGIPLHFRGAVMTILDWLESLPTEVMNARPSLWWRYGSLLLVVGQTTGVEEKLQAVEAALQAGKDDDQTRSFIGRIASARAVLALTRYDGEAMLTQSRRALDALPSNSPARATPLWTMGYGYFLQGDREAARDALTESIALGQASGDVFATIIASIGMGQVLEAENQLHHAAETYRHVLQLTGDQPLQIIYEAHLGMGRILYEWNDLEAAGKHGQQSLQLARQYERIIDRYVVCEVFLARLKLAQGDVDGAAAILAQSSQSAHQQNFVYRIPEVAAAQVLTLLRQGNLAAAAQLAEAHDLPISQARIYLAQGDPPAALAILEQVRQQVAAKRWVDEHLKVMVLQAVALHANGEIDSAIDVLGDALSMAAPEGFIRLFVDEGLPMARLLNEAAARGMMPDYLSRLRAGFEAERQMHIATAPTTHPLIEPLSQRELEVLRLIALGLSNQEIADRLFLALITVKMHNQNIFGKLHVKRRTEAVARARDLGLL